jgi:hypothetical protein
MTVVLALAVFSAWAQPTPAQLLEAAKAADSGDVTKLRALLAANLDVNAKLPNGAAIWVLAAYKGHADAVHLLLAAGAAVNTKMPDGFTALMLASENGHIDVVRELLAGKADVNVANNEGKTALETTSSAQPASPYISKTAASSKSRSTSPTAKAPARRSTTTGGRMRFRSTKVERLSRVGTGC